MDMRKPEKPKSVLYAVCALTAWTAWICLYGIFETWRSLPEVQAMIDQQLQGAFVVETKTMLQITVAVYGLVAATLAWVVYKLGQGKKWARASLLFSFAVQALWTLAPPYHGVMTYLPDVPDLGLQAYALYLLYTWPGRTWFNREDWAVEGVR